MCKVYSQSIYPERAVAFQQKKDIIQPFEEIKIIKSNISLDDCLISFTVFMFDSQVIGLERIRKEARDSLERETSQQMYSDSLVHRSGRETNRIDQNRFVIYQHEELRDSILAVFIQCWKTRPLYPLLRLFCVCVFLEYPTNTETRRQTKRRAIVTKLKTRNLLHLIFYFVIQYSDFNAIGRLRIIVEYVSSLLFVIKWHPVFIIIRNSVYFLNRENVLWQRRKLQFNQL